LSKKIRIFKLAKELNLASNELITFLRDSGFEVRNINTPVDEGMYDLVMVQFSAEKSIVEEKSEKRRKRMIMRGELIPEEIIDGDGKKAPIKDTVPTAERPAILDALETLKKTAKIEKHEEEVSEILEKSKEELDKKEKEVQVDKDKEQISVRKDIKQEEIVSKEAVSEEITDKKITRTDEIPSPPVTKEAVPDESKAVLEELKEVIKKKRRKKLSRAEIAQKKAIEDLIIETPDEAKAELDTGVKKRELVVGEKITTIDLTEFEDRRGKKAKKKKTAIQRKLSKKGKGLLEKTREREKKEVIVTTEQKDDTRVKKSKKKKRARKKKIDQKEIEASIKETLAKMEESSRLKKHRRKVKTEEIVEEESMIINVPEFISVAELAHLMDVENNELIKKCLELGLLVTINQRLDMDTIKFLADEYDYKVEELDVFSELAIEEKIEDIENEDKMEPRAPVVTIMGHVDHGKTSLLDYIRNTNVVAGEKGGITQHIGAYEVEIEEKKITFLDTPGHEAFTAMRARGAQITDIVVLVIAADDSVMPQTLEAFNHAKAADVPVIISINKIDKPNANSEKIKQRLSEHKILVEEWGGKYPSVEISAKKGTGIDELLETILIQAEILELKANPNRRVRGVVIEARQEKGKGTVCTVLVQKGTLEVGDHFICGQFHGRVRATFNERDKKIKKALPGTPVQVLGFSGMPQAGDDFVVLESDKEAKAVSQKRRILKREQEHRKTAAKSLYDISEQIKFGGKKELFLILKADTDGSIEALDDSFSKINAENEEVNISIIHKSIGGINEADVLLASASNAIIAGFNVIPNYAARNLAEKENVDIRLYDVIYDAISDVKVALEGMLEPEISEEIMATIEVRETFKIPKLGTIAGSYVLSGTVARNSKVRLIREGTVAYDGAINSLKRFKEDAREVSSGYECGVGLENYNDIKVGDVLETYKIVEEKRVLE